MVKKTKQNTNALSDLIIRLSKEPSLLEAYLRSPKEVMLGAGVPEDQIRVVISGDNKKIKMLLDDEHFVSHVISVPKS